VIFIENFWLDLSFHNVYIVPISSKILEIREKKFMIFSKHILVAACFVLLGTACNTTPVADTDEQLSAQTAGCTLPEIEEMETPLTGEGKKTTDEVKIKDEAGCILPEVSE
jgi:NAD-dependent SIR2 family protein deacetylase